MATVAASDLDGLLRHGAKLLATGVSGSTVEFTGERDEVGAFIDELHRHGIVDVVRSGPVVMRRTA